MKMNIDRGAYYRFELGAAAGLNPPPAPVSPLPVIGFNVATTGVSVSAIVNFTPARTGNILIWAAGHATAISSNPAALIELDITVNGTPVMPSLLQIQPSGAFSMAGSAIASLAIGSAGVPIAATFTALTSPDSVSANANQLQIIVLEL